MIFKNSYNWILKIQKKIDTKASIYVMFRNCVRLERNVFVTWEEYDVNEQDVDEKKECWERKKRLSHIWVKFDANWLKFQSCSVLSILIHS